MNIGEYTGETWTSSIELFSQMILHFIQVSTCILALDPISRSDPLLARIWESVWASKAKSIHVQAR